ncbi:hypothetical protein [Bartonella sp. F02]|uniref:hypothetical protein n=1 Tax=Bartonella sp. F02 TaxID=2967262 RepID=UPI0022A92721|nr:hypothetical protein [Bartonella sp. F02]MCZ2328254.1 hypothetical protein [Bartonella sp. F02]
MIERLLSALETDVYPFLENFYYTPSIYPSLDGKPVPEKTVPSITIPLPIPDVLEEVVQPVVTNRLTR